MSRRYAIIGCRPPRKSSPTYEAEMIKYRKICEAVVEQVMMLPEGSIVVTGGADGVDSVAAFQACQRGLKVIEYLPDYKKYGSKMAPLVRNILIIEGCDELIAFPASWSTGTWHGIQIAREKEKPLCVKKL